MIVGKTAAGALKEGAAAVFFLLAVSNLSMIAEKMGKEPDRGAVRLF